MKMKTIIYIRTSTEEQNPQNQLSDCISINKYGDYEVIEDKGSAWKDILRDGFEKIRIEIKSRQIEHLIVWDLDRIYRNRKRLIDFFQFCEIYKCKVHSFRQSWLDEVNNIPSPWNEIIYGLMLQVMGWLAQDESDKKSQRVKAAIRMKEDGAYSYNGKKWGRKEISSQAINKIIALHQEGKTMREICSLVQHTDKNNQMKNVSLGLVHKIISGNHRKQSIK